MDKKIFSKKFKELVNQQDISYVELSKKVDIRQDKLSKFANPNNSVKPSIDDLIALSQHFNISIDELIGNSIKSSPDKENMPNNKIYQFISLLLKLDEIFPLKFKTYNIQIDISNNGFPDIRNFDAFELSPTYDDIYRTFGREIEFHARMQCIVDFFTNFMKVKELSKGMPEIKDIWLDKTLSELRQSDEFDVICTLLKKKDIALSNYGIEFDSLDLPFN